MYCQTRGMGCLHHTAVPGTILRKQIGDSVLCVYHNVHAFENFSLGGLDFRQPGRTSWRNWMTRLLSYLSTLILNLGYSLLFVVVSFSNTRPLTHHDGKIITQMGWNHRPVFRRRVRYLRNYNHDTHSSLRYAYPLWDLHRTRMMHQDSLMVFVRMEIPVNFPRISEGWGSRHILTARRIYFTLVQRF